MVKHKQPVTFARGAGGRQGQIYALNYGTGALVTHNMCACCQIKEEWSWGTGVGSEPERESLVLVATYLYR